MTSASSPGRFSAGWSFVRSPRAARSRLYALYKQASSGDVASERPDFTDLVGRAKWDAWKALEGRSGGQAMQEYVELVESLQ